MAHFTLAFIDCKSTALVAMMMVLSLLVGTCTTSSATIRDAEVILGDFSDNIDEYLSHPLQELVAVIHQNNSNAREQWRRVIELKIKQVKESVRQDMQDGSATVENAESVEMMVNSVPYFMDGFAYGDWKSMLKGNCFSLVFFFLEAFFLRGAKRYWCLS